MTDHDVRAIIAGTSAPVSPRPGFKDELWGTLRGTLHGHQPRPAPAVRAAGSRDPRPPASRRGSGPRATRDTRPWWTSEWLLQATAAAASFIVIAVMVVWNLHAGGPTASAPPSTRQAAPPAGTTPGTQPPSGSGRTAGRGGTPPEPNGTQANVSPPGVTPTGPRHPGQPKHHGGNRGNPPATEPSMTGTIAFASKVGNYWHIFTMRADGTHRVQITHGPFNDREPDWSPDGTRIAFERMDSVTSGQADRRIYIMNADGSGLHFLVQGGEPAWSPDGTRIAYTAPNAVWHESVSVIGVDGSDPHLVVDKGVTADAAWSPRGNLMTFGGTGLETGNPINDAEQAALTNLYAVRLDGTGIRRVTRNTVYSCDSSFAADGSRVIYVSTGDGLSWHLWTWKLDGSSKRQLTSGAGTDIYPHYSPDGSMVVFERDPDGDPHWDFHAEATEPAPSAIWIMRSDGSHARRISPPGANDADPAFAPR